MSLQNLGKISEALKILKSVGNVTEAIETINGVPSAIVRALDGVSVNTAANALKALKVDISDIPGLLEKMGYETNAAVEAVKALGISAGTSTGLINRLKFAFTGLAAGFKSLMASIPVWGWIALAITAVTVPITALTAAVAKNKQEMIDAANEIVDAYKSANGTYQSNISSLENLRVRFKQLSQGVDENGERVSLTADEYDEYLSLVQQICNISPSVVQGYDNEGRAIVNYKNLLDDAISSQKEYIDNQRNIYLGNGKSIFDGKAEEYKSVGGELSDAADELYDALLPMNEWESFWNVDSLNAYYAAYKNVLTDMGIDIYKAFGQIAAGNPLNSDYYNEVYKIYEQRDGIVAKLKQSGAYTEDEINAISNAIYNLAGAYTSLNSIEGAQVDYLMEWSKDKDWYNSIPIGALDEMRNGLVGVNNPLLSFNENLAAVDEYGKAFAEAIKSDTVTSIIDMSNGLSDGSVSIESYNAAIANLKDSWDGNADVLPMIVAFLYSLTNGYSSSGDAAETAATKVKTFADAISGDVSTSIDNVQSSIKTLSGALSSLADGTLGVEDVIDLIQQFPELAGYVDLTADGFGNLDAGLRQLIKDSPSDVIKTLQQFKETNGLTGEAAAQVDSLCEALASLPTDAIRDVTGEFGRLAEQIKAAADEYNNLTNGNVDYNKRPIVPSSDVRKVYPDYDGDYATTYSQYHTIGEEGALYTIDITPILEDGTVLSQEALYEYVSNLITDNGVAGVLASDTSNLIINIQPGDYDEEYWSAYQETLGEVKNRHLELVEQLKAKEHNFTLDKVAKKMSGAFEQLDTIYADIVNGKDFDWESILNNQQFEDTFGDLGGVYDDFIKTVASSPDDISACQSAFDELATAYILNSGALKDVTDDTRNATIAMLEQMGVANAAAIVDERIALNKETARLQSELHTDATHKEVLALYDEETATRITAQAIFELAIAKIQTNENAIVTSSDIDQLEALAKSAGASTESLLNLAKAKALMAEAEGYKAASDAALNVGDLHGHLFNLRKAQAALKQAEEYYNKPITYDVDFSQYKEVSYTGGIVTQSEKDKSSKSKEETWFEKQLSLHQHLVAMNQETQEEYLAWMNTAYKQAYDEGIIELDDYYKHAEEVYTGLQDLFKDYLSDVEHEISMRENYEGEARKIIELYEGLIENVEKEIAAARSRGLTDEDDYIQELQNKWQDYTGSIKDLKDEITESAKDALDELVDYRIDMLKKDIEDEKDALDKRLDNLREFYDKQKEMLQDQRDEENYLKDQSEKRGTVADLQAELAMLANDDSAWAQKRKLELQEELATAQEDLDEFEKDHALDLALDALDKAYNDQEAQLQAEMDALEERLNDPEALYNKALEDIRKNSENQLYYQMLMYNRQYGDGNDETVKDLWESAFGSLSDYEKLFGELYKGVGLENETGVEDEGGWDDETISGTNPDNQYPAHPPTADDTADEPEKPAPPQLTDEIKTKVAAAIWNGGYGWGTGSTRSDRLTEVFGADNGIQDLVNNGVGKSGVSLTSDYTYENMRKKFKGYASGTDNATPGWHELFEGDLDEYVFTSSDGNRYRMFSGLGDKVLNAKATDFLYKFAMSGGELLSKMFGDLRSGAYIDKIVKPMQAFEIIAGDIIVQGNADSKTVSEIRRAQRDNLDYVLKEFAKLKK